MYAREPFARPPGSSGDRSNIAVRQPLIVFFCSAVNSHRSTAAAYAPLRYIARAHPSIPQGKSATGILAPAAYNESPIGLLVSRDESLVGPASGTDGSNPLPSDWFCAAV